MILRKRGFRGVMKGVVNVVEAKIGEFGVVNGVIVRGMGKIVGCESETGGA